MKGDGKAVIFTQKRDSPEDDGDLMRILNRFPISPREGSICEHPLRALFSTPKLPLGCRRMPTFRTLSIASRWCMIAAAAACSNSPDASVSPAVSDASLDLRGTTCTSTTVVLAVGAARRLTDAEAACLNFKSIQGSRYLLAYVDTRLVAKATQNAESPWPDSAIVKVEQLTGGGIFPTMVPASMSAASMPPIARHAVPDAVSLSMIPSSCPLLNVFYAHCRTTPYTVNQGITHYPNDGRPLGPARILTVVGTLAVAVFGPDASLLVPNAKQRADSALTWVAKRNIPLLQRTFSLANSTTTSDESGQLYIALQAPSNSSAGWWPNSTTGHGRWSRVTIGLSPGSAFTDASSSYTSALQILGHETMHTYQYRWRYEHAAPWLQALGTRWAIEGGATFFAQEMIRDKLDIPFDGNTEFFSSDPQDPAFPLVAYGFRVRNFTFGYSDGASMLRDLVQRLVTSGMSFDDAVSLVLVGAMEGWHGINEENQQHGLGLTRRMQAVLGSSWNPTDALLQWTMSEAADDLTGSPVYQNVTKRSYNPSTATNNIRPDAVIAPGSSVSVSRAPGTTGVFEIDGARGATYRASSNIIKNGVTPIEWLLLRIR